MERRWCQNLDDSKMLLSLPKPPQHLLHLSPMFWNILQQILCLIIHDLRLHPVLVENYSLFTLETWKHTSPLIWKLYLHMVWNLQSFCLLSPLQLKTSQIDFLSNISKLPVESPCFSLLNVPNFLTIKQATNIFKRGL